MLRDKFPFSLILISLIDNKIKFKSIVKKYFTFTKIQEKLFSKPLKFEKSKKSPVRNHRHVL